MSGEKSIKTAPKRLNILVVVIGALALCLIYSGFNTKFSWHFEELPGFMNCDYLAEAFLAGQLHLKQPVDPGRLASDDPLNPKLPFPFMADAIIWNGKYYFRHAPFPALIHALWIRITGLACPTGLVVVAFATANVVVLGVLLGMLRRRFFSDAPSWAVWYCVMGFALCAPQMYIAGRPVVYNEAVCVGAFFVLAGTLSFVCSLSAGARGTWLFASAGALFGAAVASREILIFYPLSFTLCYVAWAYKRCVPWPGLIVRLCAFFLSLGIFVGLFLIYNYGRFGNMFDFGLSHVICPDTLQYQYLMKGGNFFRWDHIVHNLGTYLFSIPEISGRFPYFRPVSETLTIGDVTVMREALYSVFLMSPVTILALVPAIAARFGPRNSDLAIVIAFCSIGPLVELTVLSSFVWTTARYLYDFVPLLFVPIFWSVCVLWSTASRMSKLQRAGEAFLILLFLANAANGLYFGYLGMSQH